MRTFRRDAPTIIGAGAFLCLVLALAPIGLRAGEPAQPVSTAPVETASIVIDTESAKQGDFSELRARLDGSDRALALNALQIALTELGDGVSLVWKRPSRDLTGVIKPVSAFRDDSGRICRHLSYSLALGTYVREVEGIACRNSDGKWSLQG